MLMSIARVLASSVLSRQSMARRLQYWSNKASSTATRGNTATINFKSGIIQTTWKMMWNKSIYIYICMLHLLVGFTDASFSPNRQPGRGIREAPPHDTRSKCPDLHGRITSARSEIAVHIPEAIHRLGVSICPQRGVLHGGAVVDLEYKM